MAYFAEVCQNPAFIVFASQYTISFVQIRLGMPANSDTTTTGKKRVSKSQPYPAGTTGNNYALHLITS
jgi:hypothetical protein